MNSPCEGKVTYLSRSDKTTCTGSVYPVFKRVLDIVFSLAGIILLALPMLIIAAIIRLGSPGAAVFRQDRVGQNGKVFSICKFRTMYCTAPKNTPTCELKDAQSHITPFGAFLRKSSLDELPQLFNVLRGDMSFVGPRPLIAEESEIHSLRQAAGVYRVRPGMTGWAQVNGRDCVTVPEKVTYDAEYAGNYSLAFDLKVIFRTIFVVASGDGYAEGHRSQNEDSSPDNSPTNRAA